MSIPKIIHYCWFGGKPLPKDCKKMIAAWEKQLPDYQIMRWDETTFDVNSSAFVRDAYRSGKYAFVSDYARLCALKEYGGVYLDTDVEFVRSFGHLTDAHSAVFGFESGDRVMTAFMAAQPRHPIISEFLDCYAQTEFDAANPVPNTVILTGLLKEKGLILNNTMQLLDDGAAVFPMDYFHAFDFSTGRLCVTEHTCTIHRCFGSWCSLRERMHFAVIRVLGKCLSEKAYCRLKSIKKRIMGERL